MTEDGLRVVFVDDAGGEFATPADDRLRAALHGDRARLGQLEIQMDSALRPRDIQARVRAGESPEAVAALAQVSVEKIMPYCVPVLAEREHIGDLGKRSHVRRKNSEGQARRLAEVVAERLRGRGVDPESVGWDAWRRDDSRWTLQATYLSGERERSARFVFDAIGRYSVADDDEARWLTGERQSTRKGPQPREGGRGGDRRLSAVPDGEDLLSLHETGDEELSDDLTAVVRAVRELDEDAEGTRSEGGEASLVTAPDESTPAEAAGHNVQAAAEQASGNGEEAAQSGHEAGEPETESTPERKRRGNKRASVPSWDEIMFGKDKNQ
ncbi:MAG: DUF3071 domain-containing protein [Nocardioidaceae bacterium]|nr:DUF3071 domain-containing protein [Nocardioidaceae bacterium]